MAHASIGYIILFDKLGDGVFGIEVHVGWTVNEMEWALFGLEYLAKARSATHQDFNHLMTEVRDYRDARRESWYGTCKNIVGTLYHYSMEFVDSTDIPNDRFASPATFDAGLASYREWVQSMADELELESQKYRDENGVDQPPYLVVATQRQVSSIASAIDYVRSKKTEVSASPPNADLLVGVATRFHESVLSLQHHPHNGVIFDIKDEWDCQYLFRAILAAYVSDIRDEEWNPSVAGSSARCEFFLKAFNTMIELKYVRKSSDAKKIKSELATDLLDYGGNSEVSHVICLVYDPRHLLKNPQAMRDDLSKPARGLEKISVVVSPPRS